MKRLFDSQLHLHFDLTTKPAFKANQIFGNMQLKGRFAEKLILYDMLIVPTTDFAIVSALIDWMGPPTFMEALETKAIEFFKYSGFLGYSGNGVGLAHFEIRRGRNVTKPLDWQAKAAISGDSEFALRSYLAHQAKRLSAKDAGRVVNKVLDCTSEGKFDEFARKVGHETYMDILRSDLLQSYFAIRNANLKRLAEVAPAEIRVFTPHLGREADDVDLMLRLASINFELYCAELSGADDLYIDPAIEILLLAKSDQIHSKGKWESFVKLLEINKVPDIASAVANNQLQLSDIWDIRNSSNSVKFRRWFHENISENPDKVAEEYIATVQQTSPIDKKWVKTIRFVLPLFAGLGADFAIGTQGISTALGATFSLVDSFWLNKLLRGYSPKFFIDDLMGKLSKVHSR